MTSTVSNRRRRKSPTDALPDPSTDLPVVSLSSPTKRKPSWVVAGVVLVGIAALLGAYVFASITETSRIMVAARDLNPGEVIGPGDIRVAEIGGTAPFRSVSPEDQSLVIGATPRGPIPADTAINTSLFVDPTDVIPDGHVIVGGAFGAGEVPTPSLAVGERVQLFAVQPSVVGAGGAQALTATEVGEATIWSIEGQAIAGGSSDLVWVSMLVEQAIAPSVVQAVGDDRLRLVLMNP